MIYTIGILQSRIEGSVFGIHTGLWDCVGGVQESYGGFYKLGILVWGVLVITALLVW